MSVEAQQQQQQDELSFLRAGQAEQNLVASLTSALNVSRLHDLGNVAVLEAVKALSEALTGFLQLREQAVILVTDQRVYVNGRLVRAQGSGRSWQEDFLGFMDRMALGGLVLAGSWTEPTVRQLLTICRRIDKEVAREQRPKTLHRELGNLPGASELLVLDPAQAELFVQEESEGYVSSKERAAYYYARLLALAEAALKAVAAGASPDVHVRHLRQTTMRLIDHMADPAFELRLLGLTVLEPVPGAELAQHCANVAVLSLGIGRLLGLERGSLSDLIYAGLYHDLGRAGESPPGALQADPQHVVRAVGYCLRARQYGTGGLLRLVSCHEHHLTADGFPQPALRAPHVLSEVVSVADAFDHATSEGGASASPRATLQRLLTDSPHPPAVTALLRDLLGNYPRGTTLRLWDGSIAVVVGGGAQRGHRPIVRRVLGADMTPDPQQPLLELPNPDQVAEEVDPGQFAIDWRTAVLE